MFACPKASIGIISLPLIYIINPLPTAAHCEHVKQTLPVHDPFIYFDNADDRAKIMGHLA